MNSAAKVLVSVILFFLYVLLFMNYFGGMLPLDSFGQIVVSGLALCVFATLLTYGTITVLSKIFPERKR